MSKTIDPDDVRRKVCIQIAKKVLVIVISDSSLVCHARFVSATYIVACIEQRNTADRKNKGLRFALSRQTTGALSILRNPEMK
jgi:hypothetical protein